MSIFNRLLLLGIKLPNRNRQSFSFMASLCSPSLGKIRKSKKRIGYFASISWVVVTILILILIFVKRISLGFFPVEYTIAIASVGSIIIFWGIILVLSSLGIGLRAFVQMLYREPTADRTEAESTYKKQLLDKLNAARDTSAGFASITTAIVGIIVAVATWQGSVRPAYIDAIIFATTFLLVLATIILIHCIDMCDTALNPHLPISMLERIRAEAMNYYALGLFSLIAAMLLGIAVINPYLTTMASISYMLIVLHYFFMWETG